MGSTCYSCSPHRHSWTLQCSWRKPVRSWAHRFSQPSSLSPWGRSKALNCLRSASPHSCWMVPGRTQTWTADGLLFPLHLGGDTHSSGEGGEFKQEGKGLSKRSGKKWTWWAPHNSQRPAFSPSFLKEAKFHPIEMKVLCFIHGQRNHCETSFPLFLFNVNTGFTEACIVCTFLGRAGNVYEKMRKTTN